MRILKKYSPSLKSLLILIFCSALIFGDTEQVFAQGNNEVDHVDEGDTKREEIQRYIGYEDLLFRYLSLPYDSSINVNLTANFVDISFIYLMFLPLMLIILIRKKNKWLALLVALISITMVLIATSNSYIYDPISQRGSPTKDGVITVPFSDNWSTKPMATMVHKLHQLTTKMYTPFKFVGDKITGQADHFTYPFLLLLFVLTGYLMYRFIQNRKSNTLITVGFLFFNYSFFWLVLSSGIIWYGLLMLVLGFVLLILMLKKIKEREAFHYKWIMPTFVGMCSIWFIMSFALRIGNITPGTHESMIGVGPFHPILYDYSSGAKTEKQVLDRLYPGFYDTMNKINADEKAKVYQIGTSFTYFVKNNHIRVQVDNQLGMYNRLTKRYPDKNELVEVFKASGFKYMVLDYNTVTIDKTSNRSLSQKYQSFINFDTNRIIEGTDPNTGQTTRFYGIFGKQIFPGSYAIFELI